MSPAEEMLENKRGKKLFREAPSFSLASSRSFFSALLFLLFFLSPRFRISSASSSKSLFKIQNCCLEKSWLLLVFHFPSLIIFSSSPAQPLSRSHLFLSPDLFSNPSMLTFRFLFSSSICSLPVPSFFYVFLSLSISLSLPKISLSLVVLSFSLFYSLSYPLEIFPSSV